MLDVQGGMFFDEVFFFRSSFLVQFFLEMHGIGFSFSLDSPALFGSLVSFLPLFSLHLHLVYDICKCGGSVTVTVR
jgi:hypothetical protein